MAFYRLFLAGSVSKSASALFKPSLVIEMQPVDRSACENRQSTEAEAETARRRDGEGRRQLQYLVAVRVA